MTAFRTSFIWWLADAFLYLVYFFGGNGEGIEGRVTEAGGLSLFTDTNGYSKGSGSL